MTISRYLPFFRFVSLLKDGLYVPNATRFEDKWEGLLGSVIRERSTLEKGSKYIYSTADDRNALKWIHVSCWYLGVAENFLMWKSYGGVQESVMIESSKDRLEDAYRNSDEFFAAHLDEVVYYEKDREPTHIRLPSIIAPFDQPRPFFTGMPDLIDLMPGLFTKHNYFKSENECRLVFVNKRSSEDNRQPEDGLILGIPKPQEFIKKVRVSPFSPDVVFDTIEMVISRFAPGIPVERSQIDVRK